MFKKRSSLCLHVKNYRSSMFDDLDNKRSLTRHETLMMRAWYLSSRTRVGSNSQCRLLLFDSSERELCISLWSDPIVNMSMTSLSKYAACQFVALLVVYILYAYMTSVMTFLSVMNIRQGPLQILAHHLLNRRAED